MVVTRSTIQEPGHDGDVGHGEGSDEEIVAGGADP